MHDERVSQGLHGETIPPLESAGWYLAGVWRVTGHPVDRRRREGPGDRARGALDVAVRVERLSFGSLASEEPALRNPRAAHLMAVADSAVTFGLTWHISRWTRLQLNGMREQVSDSARSPIPGRVVFWTQIARVQFAM